MNETSPPDPGRPDAQRPWTHAYPPGIVWNAVIRTNPPVHEKVLHHCRRTPSPPRSIFSARSPAMARWAAASTRWPAPCRPIWG